MNPLYKNERGTALVIELVVLALVITVAGIAALRYSEHRKASNPATTPLPRTPIPTPDPYPGWKTYKFEKEGLSVRFPPSWKLTEHAPAEYTFGGFSLASANNFVILVELKASPQDGAYAPAQQLVFEDELKSSNYGKPLYVEGRFNTEKNCCDLLTIHDRASINGGYRSKIQEHVPGNSKQLYELHELYNQVRVWGRYYTPDGHPNPSNHGVRDSDRPHADSDPVVQEARKILGSLKYY